MNEEWSKFDPKLQEIFNNFDTYEEARKDIIKKTST